jgi:two-component system chemotaxis sensor kinase CheA
VSEDFSPELQSELLDDFYAECDESLAAMRVDLTVLESSLGHGATNAKALESLFRHMHSLKGNAAIVGLRDAEQLAHGAENYLRALSRSEVALNGAGLELLSRGVQRLEHVIGVHRAGGSPPPIGELAEQFSSIAQAGSEAPADVSASPSAGHERAEAILHLKSLQERGFSLWRCTFAPTAPLNARGINVDAVRKRLAETGEIIRSAPRVGAGGIAFEFEVGFPAAPSDPSYWENDGIKLVPFSPPPAPAEDPTLAETSSLFVAPSHIVRVNLDRLDELMRITGELMIQRSHLDDRINRAGALNAEDLQEVNVALARSLRGLRQAITRVRMVSIAEIFSRMPFAVRDLAGEMGRKVRLKLEGQQTEIDKYLVERLKEPLLHLMRNALAHGIEAPAERVAAGKAAEATIVLRAVASGASVLIQIRDDGRGIDSAAIADRVRHLGLPVPEVLDAPAILRLICSSGFSTRDEADRASGRGVGMAVVLATVAELGGTLSMQTEPGRFTEFTLRLPLTLSITDTVIVAAERQICAVPQGAIQEIVQVSERQIRRIQKVEVAPYRDGLIPLIRLRQVFRTAASGEANTTVLVFESDRGLRGLAVDRVVGQREVVIRSLSDPLLKVPGFSGATELGDGRPVLIVDAPALALAS